jgi:DNA polymerase-3 subunit beta
VQSITEKKTGMPILFNTLLKASDARTIEFSATDLELSLCTRMESRVDIPGSSTVSARKLLEIVRELPDENITLEQLLNDKLLIQSGRSRFELSTIPADDFPHMNFYLDAEFSKCDVSVLKNSLSKTLYAVPVEEDPFSIAGLYWHRVESGAVRFVSSDGHRLAYYGMPEDVFSELDLGKGIIIPRKGVQEILKVLEKEEDVSLALHENCLILKAPDTVLSIQLLEMEFPDYQLIIPDDRPFSFLVDRETFFHALKRVAVLTNQKWRYVRFIVSSGALELEAGNPEVGNASDAVDIEYEGESFTVAFNIKYVMDTVQAMESPHVQFEWVDQFHGGVFVSPDDAGYLSLIMPMVV